MKISDSAVLSKYSLSTGDGNFNFYRCYGCHKLFTREHERRVFELASMVPETDLRICACGSMRYSPSWPVWFPFLEWLYPSVLKYTAKLVLVRWLAPKLEAKYPQFLPLIERLVANEWESREWQTTK